MGSLEVMKMLVFTSLWVNVICSTHLNCTCNCNTIVSVKFRLFDGYYFSGYMQTQDEEERTVYCEASSLVPVTYNVKILYASRQTGLILSRRSVTFLSPTDLVLMCTARTMDGKFAKSARFIVKGLPPMRLSAEKSMNEGELLIKLSDSKWHTVCSDSFTKTRITGRVACRQLGFYDFQKLLNPLSNNRNIILLDILGSEYSHIAELYNVRFKCIGSEKHLFMCNTKTFAISGATNTSESSKTSMVTTANPSSNNESMEPTKSTTSLAPSATCRSGPVKLKCTPNLLRRMQIESRVRPSRMDDIYLKLRLERPENLPNDANSIYVGEKFKVVCQLRFELPRLQTLRMYHIKDGQSTELDITPKDEDLQYSTDKTNVKMKIVFNRVTSNDSIKDTFKCKGIDLVDGIHKEISREIVFRRSYISSAIYSRRFQPSSFYYCKTNTTVKGTTAKLHWIKNGVRLPTVKNFLKIKNPSIPEKICCVAEEIINGLKFSAQDCVFALQYRHKYVYRGFSSSGGRGGRFGRIQYLVAPSSGCFKMSLFGASGGSTSVIRGGHGAAVHVEVKLRDAEILSIIVGQTGSNARRGAGGGGGSFVYRTNSTLLYGAAGGGGGGADDGDYDCDGRRESNGGDSAADSQAQGGKNGQPGQRKRVYYPHVAGPGAGWRGRGTPRSHQNDGESGGSVAEIWIGGAGGAGDQDGGDGGYGGGGGGASGRHWGGGGGGGYSGGGASSRYSGGGGGSFCLPNSKCVKIKGGNKYREGRVIIEGPVECGGK